MTGANYTGGKRNVARTRFRDSTRRVQKNHFGRRRLNILSRGLVNGTHHPAEEETTASGISGILLEHAQREISRPSISSPVHQTEALRGALSPDPSTRSSNVAPSNVRFTHTLYNESCESPRPPFSSCAGRPPEDSSLRARVNRILEFSRTVGLCNYQTSPRQGASASPASLFDSESGWLDPLQQRNEKSISPVGGSSSRQKIKACIGYAVQDSEILPMSQTGTSQSNLLREAASCSELAYESETDLVHAEPTSNYEYLEYCNSESPAQSTCVLEPLLSEDEGSLRASESNLYRTAPLTPSFDALEFMTSPLPPSSPLTSSTTHRSLLSLYQVSHGGETTLLGFDKTPLPSSVSSSDEVGSSSRYGGTRHITPDPASASPLQHIPRSRLAHKIPTLLTSHSKADLIPDLLTCDDPWNVIGDVLDLPPIPSADTTYFNRIRSHHTLFHERVSSPTSSWSLGEVGMACTARDEGARLGTVHSDGDLLYRPDPSSLGSSHQTSRRTSSLLLCRDSPKKGLSPELFRSIQGTHASSDAESHNPSSSPSSRNFPVLSDAPQPPLEPLALPASPGPLRGISEMSRGSSPALVKTLPPSPSILPQGSPSPDKLNSLKSVSHSSRALSSEWNATTGFDPVELIDDVSRTQITTSRAQPPKLEGPDLFQDEDSLGDMF